MEQLPALCISRKRYCRDRVRVDSAGSGDSEDGDWTESFPDAVTTLTGPIISGLPGYTNRRRNPGTQRSPSVWNPGHQPIFQSAWTWYVCRAVLRIRRPACLANDKRGDNRVRHFSLKKFIGYFRVNVQLSNVAGYYPLFYFISVSELFDLFGRNTHDC